MFAAVATNLRPKKGGTERFNENISLLDLESFEASITLKEPAFVLHMCVNSTLTKLACALNGGIVRLWNLSDRTSTVITFPVLTQMRDICFLHHSNKLFIKHELVMNLHEYVNNIDSWDLDNFALDFSICVGANDATPLVVSSNDSTLFSGSIDNRKHYLCACDTSTGKIIAREEQMFVNFVALHDRTNRIATSDLYSVHILEASSLQQLQRIDFDNHDTPSFGGCIEFSCNGEFLAVANRVRVNMFGVDSGALLHSFEKFRGYPNTLCFSPDDSKLFVFQDMSITVYDCSSGKYERDMYCQAVAFHKSPQQVVLL